MHRTNSSRTHTCASTGSGRGAGVGKSLHFGEVLQDVLQQVLTGGQSINKSESLSLQGNNDSFPSRIMLL